jgi:hypothetical protein
MGRTGFLHGNMEKSLYYRLAQQIEQAKMAV